MSLTFNKLNNLSNPHQGKDKKVLTVCSAGLLRSPTAAFVLQREFGFNTRAAGVDGRYALITVDEALLAWAEEIVFMEESHYNDILMQDTYDAEQKGHIKRKAMILNIPDRYARMDEELQALILAAYKAQQYD